MDRLFVFKAVAREGKLQLCVSIKGRSAEGRSYRVINVAHPDLSTLGKDGVFSGKSELALLANKAILERVTHAQSIVSNRAPTSIKDFLSIFDDTTVSTDMTIGEYIEHYVDYIKSPNNGRMPSTSWRRYLTVQRKLSFLNMDKTEMSNIDNAFYEKFCSLIRDGKAPDTFRKYNPNNCGCHGYKGLSSDLKTVLNRAFEEKLIPEKITYQWSKYMPIGTEPICQSRMNVPTEGEWEAFLRADLRRYTYANRDIHKLELMRAVIIVLVETLSRPVDVLTMRVEDVERMSWSYVPTKFKQKPFAFKKNIKKPIGLTNMAYKCVARYWNVSNAGYVFPFKCNMEEHVNEHKYMMDIANMGSKINQWLKLLTNSIFANDVSLYSFRHFAITRAVNRGMNVADVATLAKTSIQQINATYYERDGMASMAKLEALLASNPQVY